jgi:hypothetical protein
MQRKVTLDGVEVTFRKRWAGPAHPTSGVHPTGWKVDHASDWSKLDSLVASGELESESGGPATYGHVSYWLARCPECRAKAGWHALNCYSEAGRPALEDTQTWRKRVAQ